MKKNSTNDYAVALYNSTKGLTGPALKKAVGEFAALLAKMGLLNQGDKIISEFVRYSKKQAGVVSIEITSARELPEKVISEIKKVFGSEVESTQKTDPSLLGGVKVKTDNMIFDASLQKQLQLLKQSII